MKVTGVKTYVVENEPGERSGGGDPTIRWYVGGKFFLILELTTDEGIIGIGSGGNYALAAAKVLIDTKMSAEEIAKKSIQVASEICVFTNNNITLEKI